MRDVQMEVWCPIEEFPGYSVSDLARVRNDRYNRILSVFETGGGILHVGMVKGRFQRNRSLSKLVAQNFLKLPNPNWTLPTPIHLNGRKHDCRADNLMWRPRWFAIQYALQFNVDWRPAPPIRDIETGIVFRDIWDELISVHGLLYSDVIQSIRDRTYVFPTFQRFEWAD